jgi:L-aminopeptidase/D-esterase-like protein
MIASALRRSPIVSNSGETISAVTGAVVERALDEAGFLEQDEHLEQVAHALGVRDDAVAQRVAAVAAQHLGGGLEDRQLLEARLAVRLGARALDDAQRPRVGRGRRGGGAGARLRRARVVGLEPRHREQLGDDRLVLVRALAQVDRREVKAEDLHRRGSAARGAGRSSASA